MEGMGGISNREGYVHLKYQATATAKYDFAAIPLKSQDALEIYTEMNKLFNDKTFKPDEAQLKQLESAYHQVKKGFNNKASRSLLVVFQDFIGYKGKAARTLAQQAIAGQKLEDARENYDSSLRAGVKLLREDVSKAADKTGSVVGEITNFGKNIFKSGKKKKAEKKEELKEKREKLKNRDVTHVKGKGTGGLAEGTQGFGKLAEEVSRDVAQRKWWQ